MITAPSRNAGEHALPERHAVPQHEQYMIAAADALRGEPAGHLTRPLGHVPEGDPLLGAISLDQPECDGLRLLDGDPVEPVGRPVEPFELGPAELAVGPLIVLALGEQEVACGTERGGAG
jgi:hypothetical protein